MKKNELFKKLLGFIKENRRTILVALISVILISVFVYIKSNNLINSAQKNSDPMAEFYYDSRGTAAWIGAISTVLLVFVIFMNPWKCENKFLLLAIPLCFMYSIILPVFKAPDENAHFNRAYALANGVIQPDEKGGSDFPGNLTIPVDLRLRDTSDLWEVETDSEVSDYKMYPATALYSPIVYAPQSLGIMVAELFTNKTIVIVYFARLFNFLSVIAIVYFAIKYIPIGKNILLSIFFIPMNLHQVISISPDGMTTALALAFISFVLYWRYNEKRDKLDKFNITLLYIMSFLICLYKIVYLPLCLLLFLIPKEKFGEKKTYYTHVIIVGTIILGASVWSLLQSTQYLVEYNPGVNSSEQIQFILSQPFKYLTTLTSSIYFGFETYLYTLFGASLGRLDISVDRLLIFISIATVLYVGVKESILKHNDKISKYLFVFTFVVITILIFTSLYIQWTPVGDSGIAGVQGRYFIPILALLFLTRIKVNHEVDTNVMLTVSWSVNFCIILTLFYSCY